MEHASKDVGVELIALNLHDVAFHATGRAPNGETEAGIRLGVRTSRPSRSELIVQLTMDLDHAEVLKFSVQYRLRLRLSRDPEGDLDDFWRLCAARLAPTIAFPYFRETVNSLTAKANIPLLLPVTNVGALLDPSEIKLPGDAGDSTDEAPVST